MKDSAPTGESGAGSGRAFTYDARSLIIEKRQQQRRGQRVILGGLALAFWAVWGVLWQPFANTIGWLFAAMHSYEHIVELKGWQALVIQLPFFGMVIGVIDSGLIIWAIINWRRFAGNERRRRWRSVTGEDLSAWLAQPLEEVVAWRQAQRLVAHYDASGLLTHMENDQTPAAVAPAPS